MTKKGDEVTEIKEWVKRNTLRWYRHLISENRMEKRMNQSNVAAVSGDGGHPKL